MTIERKYENKDRFKTTLAERTYLLIVFALIFCVFLFVLPSFIRKSPVADKKNETKTGKITSYRLEVKKNWVNRGGSGEKFANLKNNKKNQDNKKNQVKHIRVKTSSSVSSQKSFPDAPRQFDAVSALQTDVVFILDVSPTMLIKDDDGNRVLNAISGIDLMMKSPNIGRAYLLCMDTSGITEYIMAKKYGVPSRVISDVRKRVNSQFSDISKDLRPAFTRAFNRLYGTKKAKIIVLTDGFGINIPETADFLKNHRNENISLAFIAVGKTYQSADYSWISVLKKDEVPYTNDNIFGEINDMPQYIRFFAPLNSDGLKNLAGIYGDTSVFFWLNTASLQEIDSIINSKGKDY